MGQPGYGGDRLFDIGCLAVVAGFGFLVEGLDRVGSAGYRKDRGIAEVAAEFFGIDGGRGDDDFKLRPPGEKIL